MYVALKGGTVSTISEIAECYGIPKNQLMKVVHTPGVVGLSRHRARNRRRHTFAKVGWTNQHPVAEDVTLTRGYGEVIRALGNRCVGHGPCATGRDMVRYLRRLCNDHDGTANTA